MGDVKLLVRERAARRSGVEQRGERRRRGRRTLQAVIVVDASAALAALLNAGPARRALAHEQLHVPHLIDSEVANALRRASVAQRLDAGAAWATLDAWRRLGMTRYPAHSLLERIWELRDNLSAYDATYVGLAELLGCSLVTADARLGRSPGIGCPVTVVPR